MEPARLSQIVRRKYEYTVIEKEKVTSRLLRVGHMVLNGPETIHLAGGDGHLYLEATLSLRWRTDFRPDETSGNP